MPDMRMRRVLLALVVLGVVLSCVGTLLYITAPSFRELENGRIFWVRLTLIIAWLILVPIFFYLIRLRSRARRTSRTRLAQRQQELNELNEQATEMLTPEGIRAIGGGEGETRPLEEKPQT